MFACFSNFIVLFTALIIPAVTVLWNSNPIGFPMAYTAWPTFIFSELPSVAYVSPVIFILQIDKSRLELDQTTLALYDLPSSKVT